MKIYYGVKQLANLAGISVRTLHVYDQIGLLKPSIRTPAGYRQYGEKELLRLQQVLFYKELDFPLREIRLILDDAAFDLVQALESHKAALHSKKNRLETLLDTINKTIQHLKYKNMENFEELYAGMSVEKALAYRQEAISKWGEEAVSSSEKALAKLSKPDLERLKNDQKDIIQQLRALLNKQAECNLVQNQIARHYSNICSFWGVSDLKADQYKGLGDLYLADGRYTTIDGKADPEFASFVQKAMNYFADTQLK